MKILQAKVDWSPRYDNDPSFKILVDEMPTPLYEERSPGIFVSETEGMYNILSAGGDGRGFGGATLSLEMIDGTTRSLKGPYQSGYAEKPVSGISITNDPMVFERGHTYHSGALGLERLKECAELTHTWLVETFHARWETDKVTRIFPTLRRTPPKGSAKCQMTPWMNKWRFIYPTTGPWVDVSPGARTLLHERSISELNDIVASLNESRPSPSATSAIQYALDIAGLPRLTALVTRGIGESEYEACRLLCVLSVKDFDKDQQ